MMTLTRIAQWIVRLTGPTQVVLGLLFWTGRALTLLPLHMLIGIVAMVVAARLARFIRSNPRRARVLAAEPLTLG